MKDRLQKFLYAENISQSLFADTIKVARASVSHILAGRNKPSYDFIINTMDSYPRLNIEWLIKGIGKMYRTDLESTPRDTASQNISLFSPIEDVSNQIQKTESNNHIIDDDITSLNKLSDKNIVTNVNIAEISKPDKKRSVTKIMIFYDDNSFQEFKG